MKNSYLTMSFYNMIFGENANSDLILKALDLTRKDIGRFRDIFLKDGKIELYTRLGGGNRRCPCDKDEVENHSCSVCYRNEIERLQNHPNYIKDEDDNFDDTYATFYFEYPEKHKKWLKALEMGELDLSKKSEIEDLKENYPNLVDLIEE